MTARQFLPLTFVCCFAAALPAAAQKTDIIELANGDRITCEIQKLERGKVTIKTDGIGTISIEWDDVERMASTATYDVELASGERMVGSIARGDVRTIEVVTPSASERVALETIVRLARLRRTFWRRLDGSLAAGFSFTQADVQTQWNFDTNVSYRSTRWLTTLSANSLVTTREEVDSQTRNDLLLQAQRFFRPRWSYVGLGIFQQNEELGLELRSVAGGGLVRILKQSNRTAAEAQMGVALTREQYVGQSGQSIAEAVGGLDWDWFTFDGRSTNLDLGVLTFIALESDARFRLELNASFKSDIISDLYWSINLFESFNSDPPEGQKRTDVNISASVGLSF